MIKIRDNECDVHIGLLFGTVKYSTGVVDKLRKPNSRFEETPDSSNLVATKPDCEVLMLLLLPLMMMLLMIEHEAKHYSREMITLR